MGAETTDEMQLLQTKRQKDKRTVTKHETVSKSNRTSPTGIDPETGALTGDKDIIELQCPNYEGPVNGWKCGQELTGIINKHCKDPKQGWYRVCPGMCGRTPSGPGGCAGEGNPPEGSYIPCWCDPMDKDCYMRCHAEGKTVNEMTVAQKQALGYVEDNPRGWVDPDPASTMAPAGNTCLTPRCPNYEGPVNGWKCGQGLDGITPATDAEIEALGYTTAEEIDAAKNGALAGILAIRKSHCFDPTKGWYRVCAGTCGRVGNTPAECAGDSSAEGMDNWKICHECHNDQTRDCYDACHQHGQSIKDIGGVDAQFP